MNPKQASFVRNCRNKDNCALDGECFTPNKIHHADRKFHYDTSETTFKERRSNHALDFKHVNLNLLNTSGNSKTMISIIVLSD